MNKITELRKGMKKEGIDCLAIVPGPNLYYIRSKNFHLSYCSNIHSGNDWKSHFKNIKKYVPIIKKQVCPNKNFGLGLRLSNLASKELDSKNNLSNFKDWLKQENIYIFTMNGFPYGNFHGNKVKELVHERDWTNQDRVNYTIRLFNQLAYLLSLIHI